MRMKFAKEQLYGLSWDVIRIAKSKVTLLSIIKVMSRLVQRIDRIWNLRASSRMNAGHEKCACGWSAADLKLCVRVRVVSHIRISTPVDRMYGDEFLVIFDKIHRDFRNLKACQIARLAILFKVFKMKTFNSWAAGKIKPF